MYASKSIHKISRQNSLKKIYNGYIGINDTEYNYNQSFTPTFESTQIVYYSFLPFLSTEKTLE